MKSLRVCHRRPVVIPLTAAIAMLVLDAASAQAASEGGLVLVPDLQTLIVRIVAFALLILPMNALVFKPVFRVLDARRERIDGACRRAAQLGREADAVLARYQAAVREVEESAEHERRQRLDEARRERGATTARARADAEGEIERARREVKLALGEARATLRSEAEELAREVAQRVLGRAVS